MQATHEYHKLLERILNEGTHKKDRTGTGTTSIFSHYYKVDMKHGFPLITTKRLHTKSIIHELLWFLNGDTNIKYLNDNGVTIWDEWADANGDLGPVYGKQWRDWGGDEFIHGDLKNGIDQIKNLIEQLKTNPDSRRLMVSAWNVGELDKMALRPCHWAFELYTEELTIQERVALQNSIEVERWDTDTPEFMEKMMDEMNIPKGRLSLKWHQRSVDTFLGLPFNIASYAFLLHMFAQQVNMIPGTLIGDLTNVHIYDNHIEYVKKQLKRPYHKYNAPTLKLNNKFTDEERWDIFASTGFDALVPGTKRDELFNKVSTTKDIFNYKFEDFEIENYEYFPNWKNVPIAV